MQIFVKTLAGKTHAFNVEPTLDILHLKQLIQDQEGVPTPKHRLFYVRRELEDGHTLADYNINEGATIIFVLRFRQKRAEENA